MDNSENDRSTPSELDDPFKEHPQTLNDGQKRLIGIVDGFATYYDTRQHRIDVRLERFDGTYQMTGYYQLRKDEAAVDYVRTAKEHGADCRALSHWVEQRLQSKHSLTTGRIRDLRDRIKHVVQTVR